MKNVVTMPDFSVWAENLITKKQIAEALEQSFKQGQAMESRKINEKYVDIVEDIS